MPHREFVLKAGLRMRAGSLFARRKARRDAAGGQRAARAAARHQALQAARQMACADDRMQCITAYARGGYFHGGDALGMFAFVPEIPLENWRE
jgi:hypothetical protein